MVFYGGQQPLNNWWKLCLKSCWRLLMRHTIVEIPETVYTMRHNCSPCALARVSSWRQHRSIFVRKNSGSNSVYSLLIDGLPLNNFTERWGRRECWMMYWMVFRDLFQTYQEHWITLERFNIQSVSQEILVWNKHWIWFKMKGHGRKIGLKIQESFWQICHNDRCSPSYTPFPR